MAVSTLHLTNAYHDHSGGIRTMYHALLSTRIGRTCLAGGRIHVLGHVDRSALWRLLHACDVFIHPNPRKPFGLGPLEAMVAGAPVVAPETGGLRAYATHDNAWLSATPPTAMASTLMACLNDPAERSRRAAAGRRTSEGYTWPVAADRMFAHYEAVHAGSGLP